MTVISASTSLPVHDSLSLMEDDLLTLHVEVEDLHRLIEATPAIRDTPEGSRILFGLDRIGLTGDTLEDAVQRLGERLRTCTAETELRMAIS